MQNDLKFAGVSPVIVNSNGSADDIYAPISTQSCDITIVSDRILDDLYTPSKDDILVVVNREEYEYVHTMVIENPGSVTVQDVPYYRSNIYQRDQFFKDINGDLRFKGIIEQFDTRFESSTPIYGPLIYDRTDGTWRYDNYWNLTPNEVGDNVKEEYFTDGNESYLAVYDKFREETPERYLVTWNSTRMEWNWSGKIPYTKIEGSTVSEMTYGTENIIHFENSPIELIYGKYRYGWDPNWKRWYRKSNYLDKNGSDYTAIHPTSFHKVRNSGGTLVECVAVTGLVGGNYLVILSPETNQFTRFIKLESEFDPSEIFTDDAGNVYCLYNNTIYYWSWKFGIWFDWIKFSTPYNDVTLSYEIPGDVFHKKIVVFKFKMTDGSGSYTRDYEAFHLKDFIPPTLVDHVEPGDNMTETYIFEGYMVPNTYSQAVTQNLDRITVSAIDYISILKYVTIDKLFNKPAVMTYGEILSLALSYVYPSDIQEIGFYVEDCVSYGGAYNGSNGLMDLRIQISNFWDESDKPSTAYEMIEEMLRPFCMRMSTNAETGTPTIYNINNTSPGSRRYIVYTYQRDGSFVNKYLVGPGTGMTPIPDMSPVVYEYDVDYISNNETDATIEINNTYDKVKGTASTCVPTYSKMAMDLVDYTQREKYDAGCGNVQTNKSKGYQKESVIITIRPGQSHPATIVRKDTTDHWFYIWNGVYINPEYDLVPYSYDPLTNPDVEWYRNINKFYEYMEETTTPYGAEYGQVLNFYGGSNNPTGTGKEQFSEKSVEVKKRITAYAADNGVPPEFLETSDLGWTYHMQQGYNVLNKVNPTSARFGDGIVMQSSNRCVYKQVYENINLSSVQDQVVDINLTQSYSRTGIDVKIDVMNNNTATNKQLTNQTLISCDSDYFPVWWNADQVTVDSYYFRRYASDGSGDDSCRAVWDERIVKVYVEFSDGTFKMFNGKDWVADGENHANPFILTKMITGEKLFHNDMKYNCVRCPSDPINVRYSLTGEDIYIYYDNDMGVTDRETNDYTRCKPYNSEENAWYKWIAKCGEGQLSIRLPYVDDPAAKVYVEIWNSSILGMTGTDSTVSGVVVDHSVPFYYTLDDQYDSTQNFKEIQAFCSFLPNNVSHIKAEHLDLSISVSVPDSNLGQMFSQSDIEYEINSGNNYVEEFSGPNFLVNTKNQLVASSYSYLMFNNGLADPGEFVINGISARPECFTVQAYFNWLTIIRKIYTKTILPKYEFIQSWNLRKRQFNNALTFLHSPEIGENLLMVVSDSWDVKTGRHSIVSIECQDLDVGYIDQFMVNELPRKARAERFNLPTSKKQ